MYFIKKIFIFVIVLATVGSAQNRTDPTQKVNNSETKLAETLAEQALKAHGGTKYKNIKTLVLKGDFEVAAAGGATIPAEFFMILSGNKYLIEVVGPQSFRQTFDGKQTYHSAYGGFSFPPLTKIGLPLLQRLGDKGFVVSGLNKKKKKKKTGFRITSPDGYYTDYYLNKTTYLVESYSAVYYEGNSMSTTIVEIGKFENKNGIVIPTKYWQKVDIGGRSLYGKITVKEISINPKVDGKQFVLK